MPQRLVYITGQRFLLLGRQTLGTLPVMIIQSTGAVPAPINGDIPTLLVVNRLDIDRGVVLRFLLKSAEYLTRIKSTELEVQ